ncbi:MAG: immunity 17 family protein [Tannerellaceae bacterium]|nr:immunity 17 family protein [Tannerellaceae bacterium]
METSEYFFLFLFIAIGGLSLAAALFNMEWFFTTRQAATFVNWLGRFGARLFYGILGVALIACGITGLVIFK